MFPGLVMRPLRAIVVLLVLAAVVAGFWLWRQAGSSDAVSQESALQAYREGGGGSAATRPGVPRPGVYTFRQSGSERGGLGPAHISRSLPDRALYVITAAPGGYAEELDLSDEHIEGVRLRVGAKAVREVSRRTDVTFLGVGRDDRRDLAPAPVRLKRPLAVGARWASRYLLGELPARSRGRVLRTDVVEVEGTSIPVFVVRIVAETEGAHPAVRTDTLWWSSAHSLPLRWTIDTRVEGAVSLRTRAELALESVTPQV